MALFRPYEQGNQAPETKNPETKNPETNQSDPKDRPSRLRPVRRQQQEPTAPAAPAATRNEPEKADGSARQPRRKGTRTPTRAEAEAARMARLHPQLTPKEAKKLQRQQDREARLRSLEATENSPARKLARDHVDAQMTITEYTIPLMLVIMAVSLIFARNYLVQQITSATMFAIFALWLVNIVLRWRSFKRIALERGINPKQRGLMMYMVNRMMTVRSLRRPHPAIERGQSY
ncbi:DUF3043 domain-containing protein [Luteococcus sp.]|uniref:DUF3043 domain-containing protein n=1 Tax=Luteococcus sp. TaxID=1969402 RepID=UPI003736FE85